MARVQALEIDTTPEGDITGAGTAGYLPVFTGTSVIADSIVFQSGTTSVAIGTITPSAKAIFELSSTTQGFLAPRMTTVQRDAIAAPVDGLFLYNSTTKFFNYWDSVSAAWIQVDSSTGGDVSGSGTTNVIPRWTDGPNSVLGDSSITDTTTAITFAPTAVSSGSTRPFTFTVPASTGQTATTEVNGLIYAPGIRTWAAGTIATQREFRIAAPTYAFASASVITDATTLSCTQPTAGTNCTLTNRWALAATGAVTIVGAINSAGVQPLVKITMAANTGRTASAEVNGLIYSGATQSWAAGAIATQREWYISASTYGFASASTITDAYAFYVEAATAGTNATITNNWAAGFNNKIFVNTNVTVSETNEPQVLVRVNNSATNYAAFGKVATEAYLYVAETSTQIAFWTSNARRQIISPTGEFTFQPGAVASGAVTPFTFIMPAYTGQTASAEIPSFKFTGGSREWATGAITTQRATYFSTTTYTAVGASVITNAYGMYVEAPTASTNITITNNWALGLSGSFTAVGIVRTSGAQGLVLFTQAANTGQTASAEINGYKFAGGSRQWATGAITTQRENYISTTTYTFVGASVITNAYGMYVEAPTASTNATITNKWGIGCTGGLMVSAGASGASLFLAGGAGVTAMIESNTTNYLNFLAPDANVSGFVFGAPSDSFGALIRWSYTGATMDVGTASVGHSLNFFAGNANIVSNFATSNLSFTPVAGTIGTTPTFLFTQPAQTGATVATECVGFKFTGGSKAWASGGGTLATQRETYLSTTTYTASTNAMTITNAFGFYVDAPTASTNITITNNFAAGFNGSVKMVTGRFLGNQGADVASTNNLALGTDGNAFEITGTTQINLISNLGWQNGSEVTFIFTSNPTVKHNQATSTTDITIQLAGAADFVASAGDTLTLLLSELGGTQAWREKSRAVI